MFYVVRFLLNVVWCMLYVACWMLYVVWCMVYVVWCIWYVVYYYVVCCMLFVVTLLLLLLLVVRLQLLHHYCWSPDEPDLVLGDGFRQQVVHFDGSFGQDRWVETYSTGMITTPNNPCMLLVISICTNGKTMKTRPGVSKNMPHMDDMRAAVSFHPKGLSRVDKVTRQWVASVNSETHVFQQLIKISR